MSVPPKRKPPPPPPPLRKPLKTAVPLQRVITPEPTPTPGSPNGQHQRFSSSPGPQRIPQVPPRLSPKPSLPPRTITKDDLLARTPPPPPIRRPSPSPSPALKFFPPPPTRTIALGDKLPPRKVESAELSSEDESESEDSKIADSLPDSSTASRHAPTLSLPFTPAHIHVQAHSARATSSGSTIVVANGPKILIYDLAISSEVLYCQVLKDSKATAIMLKDANALWVGTKEGHLYELDIKSGQLTAVKHCAHIHSVTSIQRHGSRMLSIDQSGKVLIFAEPSLLTTPRPLRIFEKIDFVKMFPDGSLWTAERTDSNIRVYDIFRSSNSTIIPLPENAGPVTAAAVIPTQPNRVYVSHEGGYISLWEGYSSPRFIELMKISSSDILSLEGVNDRLWAGGRSGFIAAYDTGRRPWVVTNAWMAHNKLPVLHLFADPYSIPQLGKLAVLSVGRDERLRVWDGLLSYDWIQNQIRLKENAYRYSSFRKLDVLVVTWNCDAQKPDSLPPGDLFLKDIFGDEPPPDIVHFGFQEVIDLESRKMQAKSVLLSNSAQRKKDIEDGISLLGLSDRVTGAYKRWYDYFMLGLAKLFGPDAYAVILTDSLIGLFSCIFVKKTLRPSVRDPLVTQMKRGIGGRYGNKGGIASRFVVDESSLCFVNCHLAAGQKNVRARNADVKDILEKRAFDETENGDGGVEWVGGGDGSMILDHEIVFWNGDLNYRIDHARPTIINAISSSNFSVLAAHDQLMKELRSNPGFRLSTFTEAGPLNFAPTYKYDRKTSIYDTSEKRRSPAWCDRVLYRAPVSDDHRVTTKEYGRIDVVDVSDHRAVKARFEVLVKRVDRDQWEAVKKKVEGRWAMEERNALEQMSAWFVAME